MIKVDKVTRKYGELTAVDQVSFEIHPGEIVGLLGHNGAGKTTIMKMMTGYLEPSEGTVTIDDLDIRKDRQRVQQKIGYLPENCPVYPEMSILGFLQYSGALHGIDKDSEAELIRSAIDRTGLTEKASELISTLSRGYRQRTGVARALLHAPSILILDEPTNGLDPTQIQQMRRLIKELSETATVIISTHILQEVQAICDRVIIIKDGAVALDCRLDELQQNNRLLVSTNTEDGTEVLTALELTESVQRLKNNPPKQTGHTYEISLASGADREKAAAEISRKINEQGWDLYQLQFKSRNLETLFSEISD